MKSVWRRFVSLDFWLKLIWIFCLLGALLNAVLVAKDLRSGGVLLRLHAGFFVLYAGQIVFILLKERAVFVLSLLQAALAFATSADFTFVPVFRLLGRMAYVSLGELSVEQLKVYKYVFISACFTSELLKTWMLWALIPPAKKRTAAPVPDASCAQ